MICGISGRLSELTAEAAIVSAGALEYEILLPRFSLQELATRRGEEVRFATVEYLEGNPAVGHLVPRLIGFATPLDKAVFAELQKVKGLGMRKILRMMSVPAGQIAAAIEAGDERALSRLPECGKRTASNIIAQLSGRMAELAASAAPEPSPVAELTAAQRTAVDIIVHWGDRRADAERWVAAAVAAEADLAEPDAIVRAAYRAKQRG